MFNFSPVPASLSIDKYYKTIWDTFTCTGVIVWSIWVNKSHVSIEKYDVTNTEWRITSILLDVLYVDKSTLLLGF